MGLLNKIESISQMSKYLVDGEHLSVTLLHLLELPQEIPNPNNKTLIKDQAHINSQQQQQKERDKKFLLTRTWTWHEPRSWPRASSGKS